jgi:hypothetical protein
MAVHVRRRRSRYRWGGEEDLATDAHCQAVTLLEACSDWTVDWHHTVRGDGHTHWQVTMFGVAMIKRAGLGGGANLNVKHLNCSVYFMFFKLTRVKSRTRQYKIEQPANAPGKARVKRQCPYHIPYCTLEQPSPIGCGELIVLSIRPSLRSFVLDKRSTLNINLTLHTCYLLLIPP